QPVDVVDFAPAGRDVYSTMTRLRSRSVGAQHLGTLAGWRHISLLTERRVLREWFVAINMSLLRSEELGCTPFVRQKGCTPKPSLLGSGLSSDDDTCDCVFGETSRSLSEIGGSLNEILWQ